jgi:D-alanyl-D-alanine carboxypeptidase
MIKIVAGILLLSWLYISFVDHPLSDSYPEVVEASFEVERKLQVDKTKASDFHLSAYAYGVFDLKTGEVLYGENIDEPLPIASVTKLFTAATALEKTSPDTIISITDEDVATYGRAGNLKAGDNLSVYEILFPLLLESSNDAATAIERTVGDIAFADRVLADASGLASANQASVVELSRGVRDLYERQPHIFDITRLSKRVGEGSGWINNSPVFDLPGYVGGKHGYTDEAGRTLVALFVESDLDDRVLGYVILNSTDVLTDVQKLRASATEFITLK